MIRLMKQLSLGGMSMPLFLGCRLAPHLPSFLGGQTFLQNDLHPHQVLCMLPHVR
jgi:hypothetical protein